MSKYEVRQNTMCGGWVNNWLIDDEPQLFDSLPEAQKELYDHLDDLLLDSEYLEDEQPDGEEYRIYDLVNSEYVA